MYDGRLSLDEVIPWEAGAGLGAGAFVHSGQKGLCFRQSLYKGSVIRNDQKS